MDVQRFQDCGCNRVIGKPFRADLFHQYMREMSAGKEGKEEREEKKSTREEKKSSNEKEGKQEND
jgi:hypothetical protein